MNLFRYPSISHLQHVGSLLDPSVSQPRQMLDDVQQRGRFPMPMLVALHRRQMPTRFGIPLPQTGILLFEWWIVPRTSDGQRHHLYLPAQLYRYFFIVFQHPHRHLTSNIEIGSLCENAVVSPRCEVNPCLNGGTCYQSNDEIECVCLAGFAGTRCAVNIDDCLPSLCQNGGICVDGINNFTCNCQTTGYVASRHCLTTSFHKFPYLVSIDTKEKGANERSITASQSPANTAEHVLIGSAATSANAVADSADPIASWKCLPGYAINLFAFPFLNNRISLIFQQKKTDVVGSGCCDVRNGFVPQRRDLQFEIERN